MKAKNHSRPPEKRIVSWGKYAFKKFGDVPTDYLLWFVKNSYSQMQDRRIWAREELQRRGITDKNLLYK